MGDWDLYCALCATNTSGVDADNIGSTSPAMLAIRRSVILALKKQVESGEDVFPEPTFEDDGKDLDEADIDWDWNDESCAYDPALVSEESTEWQGDVYCLGLNAETGRGYFSGHASHLDHGRVGISVGKDPDEPIHVVRELQPGEELWISVEANSRGESFTYWTIEDGGSVVFPMHGACLGILRRVLAAPGGTDVDKKALYEAMCLLSTMFQAQLTVDYGQIRGNATDWECIPGEEFAVTVPEFSPEAKAAIRDKIASGALRRHERPTPDMSGRSISDPFRSLPNEVLCSVASHLSFADLKAVWIASWPVMNATSGNLFWKSVLYREAGWARPELEAVLGELRQEDVDYKRLWLWLEKVTRPVYALDPPWLGAANRRRVWSACEQIADVYWERQRPRVKKVE